MNAITIHRVHVNAVTLSSPCHSKLSFGKSSALGATGALVRQKSSVSTENTSFQIVAGKMKTRKSAAKRYKVTAGGKVNSSRVRERDDSRRA